MKTLKEETKKEEIKQNFDQEKMNRDYFFEMKKKHAQQFSGYEYSNGMILNKFNGKDFSLKMNSESFKILIHSLIGQKDQSKHEQKMKFKPNGEIYYV
jgi:hypothetical protein